jgi:hypothetical protein
MSRRIASLGLVLAAAAACASNQGASPSAASSTVPAAPKDTAMEALRQLVRNGSIVADVQLGRNPPIAIGACLDPVAAARFELDRSLTFVPDQPPVVATLSLPRLPESLRDSEARTGVVVARWVVDTTGIAIPTSVMIVSSPHGLMSAQVCGAILMATFRPARDDGRLVRARVEMPVRFAR